MRKLSRRAVIGMALAIAASACRHDPEHVSSSSVDATPATAASARSGANMATTYADVQAPTAAESQPSPPRAVNQVAVAQDRARALSGIGQLQALMRKRSALRNETEDACLARHDGDLDRVAVLVEMVGQERMFRPTRYATRAPNIGQRIEDAVVMCLGCLDPSEDPDDEAVPTECGQAMTALDDLANNLK